MINSGTILEEGLVIFKFILVGLFFAFIYYLFLIPRLIVVKSTFSDRFKVKKEGKSYKKIKNPKKSS